MSRPARIIAILSLILIATTSVGQAKGKKKQIAPDHPLLTLLTNTGVKRGREHRYLLVYPIARDASDPAKVVVPMASPAAIAGEDLSFSEPKKKAGRGPVEAFNWSKKNILLLQGEVLDGGVRDRFLPRDVLLKPASQTSVPAYIADRKPRKKDEAGQTLKPTGYLAPEPQRLVGVIDGPGSVVHDLLQDQYALAGEDHDRKTLVHLYTSKKMLPRMAEYEAIFGAIPDEAEGRTIGVAAMVGGRLVGIDLFGSNASFRAHWPQILKALAFQATLFEVSYGRLNQPAPAGMDPDRYGLDLKGRLKKVYAARVREEKAIGLGSEYSIFREDLVGRVLIHEGAVVHAILVRNFLDSDAVPPPPTGGTTEYTPEELARREARGTLTEAEKRLLERIRARNRPPPKLRPPGGTTPTPKPGPTPTPTPGGGPKELEPPKKK